MCKMQRSDSSEDVSEMYEKNKVLSLDASNAQEKQENLNVGPCCNVDVKEDEWRENGERTRS